MKSNRDNCGNSRSIKECIIQEHKGNGMVHLLKNKHAEVVCWLRTECLGEAEPNQWSVEMGEPQSVPSFNSVYKQR